MANADTPIVTLQDLKAWLAAQTPGSTVMVAASLFNAPMVAKLFSLLPATDSISVSNAVIDVPNATLSGEGTLLDQDNSAITISFTQPGDNLLCELKLKPPAAVTWSLIQDFKMGFTQLEATLVPNDELSVVHMNLSSVLQVGEGTTLDIPAALSIPSFDGDWILSSGEVAIGSVTADALQALAGNLDLTTLLPAKLKDLDKFEIQSFEMSFNPQKQTCSYIRIVISYKADWKFFNDAFKVNGIVLDFEVSDPITAPQFHATLMADMDLLNGAFPLQVGGQFPDNVVFARLPTDRSLMLTQAFQFFKVSLPEGFPDIEISTLGFVFYVESKGFHFKLGITKDIPIAGSVHLNNFLFDIGADFNSQTNAMEGYGSLLGQFSIGQTIIILSADYKSGQGVDIYGEIDNLPIGELISKLADDFGIDTVPEFISSINLKKLAVTYNTSTGNFTFECTGSLQVADNLMTIAVSLKAIKEAGGFNKQIEAKGTISYQDQIFTIKFDKGAVGTDFTAIWEDKGTPLSVNSVAGMLGLSGQVPEIPADLNNVLSLSGASFTYDTSPTHRAFLLTATSTVLGKADFVALSGQETGNQWQFFFGLSTGREINLADLPILDKLTVIDQGKLAIENIAVNIASVAMPGDGELAKAVRAIITKYAPDASFPQLPASGMADKVAFSMTVNIGGNIIPIGLGTSGQNDVPVTAHQASYQLAASPLASSGTMKVVWFNLQKNFGPLYFDKIGIGYKDSHIYVLVNVMATASGLSIALNGFGVGIPISDFNVAFTIDGIAITYASGPVLLSAGLQGTFSPVNLVGDMLIKTPPITIGGIGGYTEVEGKPSMFLFAVLNAPIGGPAFFFVTGLAAGFGYNRKLVIPDITGVATFPFVVWATGGSGAPVPNPNANIAEQVNQVLTDLVQKGIVAPQVGSNWLAAGIRFTSFELVDSFALLTAIFGTSVEIDLLGLSRLTVPMGAGAATGVPVVAYVELAIKATYSQGLSLVSIEGQLTKNSFVLAQACHLTGGFAFYFWFGGDHEGDFVITLGGYNTNYTPPAHYPKVPRLGMNWQVASELIIKGELYFALTSNAVMAGGLMEAVWESGGIKAWFIVQADFLIMFKPFHYDIRASVDIGASFKVDLLFTTVTMTIHVGASLHIWGPEFAGEATVHLYIISFTISFGDSGQSRPQTIEWSEFIRQMLPQKATGGNLKKQDADAPDPDVCKLVATAGLLKQLSENEGELNWIVSPEKFILTTQSIIPSKSWDFSSNITLAEEDPQNPITLNTDFGVRPVGVKNEDFSSIHSVAITKTGGEDSTFRAYFVLRNFPKALWEKIDFDAAGNPILGDPVNNTTLTGVLGGFDIIPYVAPPDHTLPIELEYLQYTLDPNLQDFWWSNPFIPVTDQVQEQKVPDTIDGALARSNRNLLLKAITDNQIDVNTSIDVDGLASLQTDYLFAVPLLRILGEEKITPSITEIPEA